MHYIHNFKLGEVVEHEIAGEGMVVHISPHYVFVKFHDLLDYMPYREGGVLKCKPHLLTYQLTLENE